MIDYRFFKGGNEIRNSLCIAASLVWGGGGKGGEILIWLPVKSPE
jgi:hypothetical protein